VGAVSTEHASGRIGIERSARISPRPAAARRCPAAALALLLLLAAGCGYNSVVVADEDVKASWAEVQNQYQRRLDLVPNLVNTVKGAAGFESDTLRAVTEARSQAQQVRVDPGVLDDPEAFQKAERAQRQLGNALGRFFGGYTEAYPNLQSVGAFRDLQAQLEGTENRIAVARMRYIEAVAGYNKIVLQFPTSLGAMLRGKNVRPTFEASADASKPPEVKF
jgi:LemA protein